MDFIEVNGTALRYELRGSGGHTVVLLHEMGGSARELGFAGTTTCRQQPRPAGTIRAGRPAGKIRGSLSIDTMVADLMALLDALNIGDRVVLVGMAVGGAIALAGAARHPERVAAASWPAAPRPVSAADRRAAVLARVERMEREGLRAVLDGLDSGYPGGAARRCASLCRLSGALARQRPRPALPAIYRMLLELDLGSELARIFCPVRWIAGALDATRPPALVEGIAAA